MGLAKRLLDGEYGDRCTGSAGVIACTGLTRSTPASVPAAKSRRSPKSPMPHDPGECSAYSCSIQPQAGGTGGRRRGVTISSRPSSSR
jgi:hypothetical protein